MPLMTVTWLMEEQLVTIGASSGRYRKTLSIPVLTAIGNHDLDKNGSNSNYQAIFGPTYYSFRVGQGYFIVLDATTEAGFDKTERVWLEKELRKSQAAQARFIFMHVPLFEVRGGTYHKSLPDRDQKDLLALFRRYKVTHLFASHLHGYFSGVQAGIPYTITGGAGGRLQGSDPGHFFSHYVKVHVHNGKANVMLRRIDAQNNGTAYLFDLMKDNIIQWGLLLAAGLLLLGIGLSMMRSRHSA